MKDESNINTINRMDDDHDGAAHAIIGSSIDAAVTTADMPSGEAAGAVDVSTVGVVADALPPPADLAPPSGPLDAASPLATRDIHIDVLKGIGMLFVIIGHIKTVEFLGYGIVAYIYTFHMPLFFLVSGYLTSAKTTAMGFGRYLGKRAVSLLVPYALFFAFSLLWNQTVYAYATGAPFFSFAYPLNDMLRAFLLQGQYLYNFALNLPLWFFPALFLLSIPFYFIVKIKRQWAILLIALALALFTLPIQSALKTSVLEPIWLLQLFPAALFYMLVGYVIGRHKGEVRGFGNSFWGLALLIIAVAMMPYGNGDIWNISSYLYFVGSLLSIFGLYMFARESSNKVLAFIGRYSLYYLGLHALIGQLPLLEIDLPAYCEAHGYTGILAYLAYLLATVLLTTLAVAIVVGCQKGITGLWNRASGKRQKQKARGKTVWHGETPAGQEPDEPYSETPFEPQNLGNDPPLSDEQLSGREQW